MVYNSVKKHLWVRVLPFFLLQFVLQDYAYGQVSYSLAKSALIIKLVDNIEWPHQSNKNQLTIGFYGKDSTVFNTISKIDENKKLQLALRWVENLDDLSNINVLYTDQSKSEAIGDIAKVIEEKEILLISEGVKDQKYIMLNIDQDVKNNSITFQINKTNIILENLIIDPKLLLLGGSEVDVRELYHEMKADLESVQYEVSKKNREIALFQTQLEKQKEEIQERHEENLALKKLGESQLMAVTKNEAKLKEYRKDLSFQLNKIKERSDKLNQRELTLNNQIKLIDNQSRLINENENKLLELINEADEKQEVINSKNIILGNQTEYISAQKKLLLYAIGILLLVLALSISVFFAYYNKKRLSAKLKDTNKKLNYSNGVLYEQKTTLDVAYEELEKAKSKLVESEKMAALGVLMAGVAHEINNPINFIKGGVTVLNLMQQSNDFSCSKEDSIKVAKVLDGIDTGADRIVKIVRSLRSFSRTVSDEKAEYDLHNIIDSALVILHHEYKNRIEVVLNYQNEAQLLECDESKMIQVFTNLISNSIQAILKEGVITISIKEEEGKIIVGINDTGIGISEEDMKSIMNPFFTTKEPGVGTGLGLSISYNIVTEYGGEIYFESTKEKGTTVYLKFPLKVK